jgi:hypothetical protein
MTSKENWVERNLPKIILLCCVIIFITIAVAAYQVCRILKTFEPSDLTGPEKIILEFLQSSSSTASLIMIAFISAIGLLMIVLSLQMIHSDKVEFWGMKFERTRALQNAFIEIDQLRRKTIGLEENLQEIYSLHGYLYALIRNESAAAFFDLLDQTSQTAAFALRPLERSLRVSIWLCNLPLNGLRIISGYRLSRHTKWHFKQELGKPGFAAHVIERKLPVIKERDFSPEAQDWDWDSYSTYKTTAIVGQPVEVGTEEDQWIACICWSTDREFEGSYFNLAEDLPILAFFADVVSSLLNVALRSPYEDPSTSYDLIQSCWKRYE